MPRPQIALVSREVHPFGGGIGTYVGALAGFLSADADVTLFMSTIHREGMAAPETRDQLLFDDRVRIAYVNEPEEDEIGSYFGHMHAYSARVLRALRREYGSHGPDLIEFQDYLGEGAVTIQARVTGEAFLAQTPVIVRLDTTAEMCSLLDGYFGRELSSESIYGLERYCLRFADRLVYGGGDVHGTYERFFGRSALAAADLLRQPLSAAGPISVRDGSSPPRDGPLRLLYMGRLERRKGVSNLLRAMSLLRDVDVTLTLIGGDTDTAPLGTSMRDQLEQMLPEHATAAYRDGQIRLLGRLPRHELPTLIDSHHAGIFPSLWECWPAVALETLSRNRPIIATPVGGLLEMTQPGRSGWRAAGCDPAQLADTIERFARQPAQVHELIDSREPRAVHEELCDAGSIREWYSGMAGRRSRSRARNVNRPPALVSAVVPYFAMPDHIEEAIMSLLDQTYSPIEVVLVNDGSFDVPDRIVARLAARLPIRVATQPNSGLGAARNLGVRISRGRFVTMLDADDVLEPHFVERAIAALEADRSMAYVSCWSRYVDENGIPNPAAGFQPISNFPPVAEHLNLSGICTALIRRSVFDRGYWYSEDLTSYEDWEFFLRLRANGLYGHCIPERLMRYRVRSESMLREMGLPEAERLHGEMRAHIIESEVQWTSTSA